MHYNFVTVTLYISLSFAALCVFSCTVFGLIGWLMVVMCVT